MFKQRKCKLHRIEKKVTTKTSIKTTYKAICYCFLTPVKVYIMK